MPYKNLSDKRKNYEATKTLHKICELCGRGFLASIYKPNARFCSGSCRQTGNAKISAKKRGDAQRGKGTKGYYIKYYGKHQHRLIMEQILGRPLTSKEIVHHKDTDKRNNAPRNLFLCSNHGEHAKLHKFSYDYLVHTGQIENYLKWFKEQL